LRKGDYKIIAEEGDVEDDVLIEADIDDEDDIVSEELAEIYLAQGLRSEAIEIYRKLSLLNSEKSIYFAEKIENIEKNN
jgi:DNA-binding SARP family transcriptional activator